MHQDSEGFSAASQELLLSPHSLFLTFSGREQNRRFNNKLVGCVCNWQLVPFHPFGPESINGEYVRWHDSIIGLRFTMISVSTFC